MNVTTRRQVRLFQCLFLSFFTPATAPTTTTTLVNLCMHKTLAREIIIHHQCLIGRLNQPFQNIPSLVLNTNYNPVQVL